jgi:hypothetical protein
MTLLPAAFTAIAVLGISAAAVASAGEKAAAPAAAPRVFLLDGKLLAETRARAAAGLPAIADAAAGDKSLARAVEDLRRDADKALKAGPFSVVFKKTAAPSGDKHDYMSQGPYWWPDPSKPDGLPYIRKDGEVHPDRGAFDNAPMGRMASAVETLATAYYFTGHEPYAAHAAKLLRAWFLDAETRMNPNLNYGQSIPGVTEGRGTGIIDTTALVRVVDAVGLLAGSPSWTAADQKALQEWFSKYVDWLLESKIGKEEAAAHNNHKTWYIVQVAAFALLAGRADVARRAVADAPRLVNSQIEPDGRQPMELARTKSWDYSSMNLDGWFCLARLGDAVGVDIWNYRSSDGRSIRKALDYLLPYAMPGGPEWPHKQIVKFSAGRLKSVIRRAAIKYGDKKYADAAAALGAGEAADRIDLLWPLPRQ